jgi:hypothetical protein
VAVNELISTTISGVVAVNVIGFVLIPHWTAVAFIFPIIIMLYFYLLGEFHLSIAMLVVSYKGMTRTSFSRVVVFLRHHYRL